MHFPAITLAVLVILISGCASQKASIQSEGLPAGPKATIRYTVISPLDATSNLPLMSSVYIERVALRAYDAMACPAHKHVVLSGLLTHDQRTLVGHIPAGRPVQIGMRYQSRAVCTTVIEFLPAEGQVYTAEFIFPVRTPESDVNQCAMRIITSGPTGSDQRVVPSVKRDEAYCPIDSSTLHHLNYPGDNFY